MVAREVVARAAAAVVAWSWWRGEARVVVVRVVAVARAVVAKVVARVAAAAQVVVREAAAVRVARAMVARVLVLVVVVAAEVATVSSAHGRSSSSENGMHTVRVRLAEHTSRGIV